MGRRRAALETLRRAEALLDAPRHDSFARRDDANVAVRPALLAARTLTLFSLGLNREVCEAYEGLVVALADTAVLDDATQLLVREVEETVRVCPFDLVCARAEDDSVQGSWTRGANVEVEGYELFRDGERLRTLAADAVDFEDDPGCRRVVHYALVPIFAETAPCADADPTLRCTVVDLECPFGPVVRINMGGPETVDSRGRVWAGDPGQSADVLDIRPDDRGGLLASVDWEIERLQPESLAGIGFDPSSAADRSLVSTIRWGKTAIGVPYRLEIPLENGVHTARLVFCENAWNPPQFRAFALELQGRVVKRALTTRDYSPDRPETGWAGALTFDGIEVDDGALRIALLACDPQADCPDARDRNPILSLLEILRTGDPPAEPDPAGR